MTLGWADDDQYVIIEKSLFSKKGKIGLNAQMSVQV